MFTGIDLEGLTSDPQPQPLRRRLPWTDDSGQFIGTREGLVPCAAEALEDVGWEELASPLCRVTLCPLLRGVWFHGWTSGEVDLG